MSGLVAQSRVTGSDVTHSFACFEAPQRDQFVEPIIANGGTVLHCPEQSELMALAADADVVQLEWWNHPATISRLCTGEWPAMRLCTWSHVSGLYTPIFPAGLIEASQRFLLTSACSRQCAEVVRATPHLGVERLAVVPSSGGFTGLPEPSQDPATPLAAGYFGSLNLAKIHPEFVHFVAAVHTPNFQLRMVGEALNQGYFERQSAALGRPDLLSFAGYSNDIAGELSQMNVNIYLLNPQHYGTCENALLETMAMGIVPVVFDNPCERNIVTHRETGLVVANAAQLATQLQWLHDNPQERVRLGNAASQSVRERFAVQGMESALRDHYACLLNEDKQQVNFQSIFGTTPASWFLSCQGEPEIFVDDGSIAPPDDTPLGHALFETTKGSVFHFHASFPNDRLLRAWSRNLGALH